MGIFDFNDPFYRPLWLRIAIVGFTAAWALLEFANGMPFWGTLFLAMSGFAFYGLFITFDPRDPDEKKADDGNGD